MLDTSSLSRFVEVTVIDRGHGLPTSKFDGADRVYEMLLNVATIHSITRSVSSEGCFIQIGPDGSSNSFITVIEPYEELAAKLRQ